MVGRIITVPGSVGGGTGMWVWLWWLVELLPAFLVAAGVYMVITRQVPRYPTYTWEWNLHTYTRATDIRALGWYYVKLGCALGAFGGFSILGVLTGFSGEWWIWLGGLWLAWLLLLVVARRWRRRAFGVPQDSWGNRNKPSSDPFSDDAGR